MEFFTDDVLWFLAAYVAGSVVTGWMVYKSQTVSIVGSTIDSLCEAGFLKHKKSPNGDIEILKWDSKDD